MPSQPRWWMRIWTVSRAYGHAAARVSRAGAIAVCLAAVGLAGVRSLRLSRPRLSCSLLPRPCWGLDAGISGPTACGPAGSFVIDRGRYVRVGPLEVRVEYR